MTRLRTVAAALAIAVLAGCGVPVSDTAEPVQDYQTPPTPSASTSAPTDARSDATLWFVSGDRLARATSPVAGPLTPTSLLTMLGTPPSSGALQTLVADPQGGPPLAAIEATPSSPPPSGTVVVQLSDTFVRLGTAEQVLLIGQVVLTLTDSGVAYVAFDDVHGAPVTVPLPDGRLVDGPVTRNDYLSLTRPAPAASG